MAFVLLKLAGTTNERMINVDADQVRAVGETDNGPERNVAVFQQGSDTPFYVLGELVEITTAITAGRKEE